MQTGRSLSPINDLNWSYQLSDLHTQQKNQAWLGKQNSGLLKEKQKGANWKRGNGEEGNLATFADHHCIEGYNPIESDMIWKKGSENFKWIWKGRATWNNGNHGDIIYQR